MTRLAHIAEWCYGLLLVTLPRDVRRAHGPDARDLFRDLALAAYEHGGLGSFLRCCMWMYVRTVVGAFTERWTGLTMTHRRPTRHRSRRMDILPLLRQDIVHALRGFRKQPGFALTAVLTVALGIGAATTIFSVVDTVVLRALPYPDSERLVFFDEGSHTGPDYADWVSRLTAFEEIAAVWPTTTDLTNEGNPTQVTIAWTSPNLFAILGARPAAGRLLVEDDGHPASNPVAVLSHSFWVRHWGGDSTVLGRSLTLGEGVFEVVGIVNDGFWAPSRMVRGDPDVWLALDLTREELQRRSMYVLGVIGRLKPGASIVQANLEMNDWERWAAESFPEQYRDASGTIRDVPLLSLHDATVQNARPSLYMLLGAVGLMLLIACANVANLFLARGADRAREIAVRAALGASRRRIVAQALTESVLLSVSGGLIGVATALLGVRAIKVLAPSGIPRLMDVAVDTRVLIFALLLSVATGIAFGIAPAVYAARTDIGEALKDTGQRLSASVGRVRLKNFLVVSELALAIILLAGAGLLFNSFVALNRVDPGFVSHDLLVMPLELGTSYEQPAGRRTQFGRELVETIAAIPGVQSVSAGVTAPFSMNGRCCFMTRARSGPGPDRDSIRVVLHPIGANYFTTLGARLTRGREFSWDVPAGSPSVAVISSKMANRFFAGQDPIGQTISVGSAGSLFSVVGVVDDMRHWSLSRDDDVDMYIPYDGIGSDISIFAIVVRTTFDAAAVSTAMRDAVWTLDPKLPVPEIVTLDRRIRQSIGDTRFLSVLLLTFSTIASFLAATGVYGTMLYAVTQRHREFGVRVALGADSPRLIRHVMQHGIALTALGVVLGIGGALLSTRVLTNMLFGVTTTDVTTFTVVAVTLSLIAILACYLPARKAALADPMVTLRVD